MCTCVRDTRHFKMNGGCISRASFYPFYNVTFICTCSFYSLKHGFMNTFQDFNGLELEQCSSFFLLLSAPAVWFEPDSRHMQSAVWFTVLQYVLMKEAKHLAKIHSMQLLNRYEYCTSIHWAKKQKINHCCETPVPQPILQCFVCFSFQLGVKKVSLFFSGIYCTLYCTQIAPLPNTHPQFLMLQLPNVTIVSLFVRNNLFFFLYRRARSNHPLVSCCKLWLNGGNQMCNKSFCYFQRPEQGYYMYCHHRRVYIFFNIEKYTGTCTVDNTHLSVDQRNCFHLYCTTVQFLVLDNKS